MAKAKLKALPQTEPLKLDFGCGPRKREGFHGVDAIKFDGVDTVMDIRKTPWPWKDESVDEAYASHFVEHLTGQERVKFFNELYRVMRKGAKATIIVPDWSNDRAYGDPTHQWPPMSRWSFLYLIKEWRDANAPHCGYTCNFISGGLTGNLEPWLIPRHQDLQMEYSQRNINSLCELVCTLDRQ